MKAHGPSGAWIYNPHQSTQPKFRIHIPVTTIQFGTEFQPGKESKKMMESFGGHSASQGAEQTKGLGDGTGQEFKILHGDKCVLQELELQSPCRHLEEDQHGGRRSDMVKSGKAMKKLRYPTERE